MKLFRKLGVLVAAGAMALSMASPAFAVTPNSHTNNFLFINSGPGYCGIGTTVISSYTDFGYPTGNSWQQSYGITSVRTGDTGCTATGGSLAVLPANQLTVQMEVQCKDLLGDTWVAYSTVRKSNSANTGLVDISTPQGDWCHDDGSGTFQSRAYIHSRYNTIAGWVQHDQAGSWVVPGN